MTKKILSIAILLVLLFAPAEPALAADEPLTVEIPVEIALEGSVYDAADTFTVEIAAETDNAPMPAEAALNFEGAGSDKFVIEYPDMGVFSYTIKQLAGDDPDCIYDSTIYTLTVFVTVSESGELETTVVLKDPDENKMDTAIFTNEYAPLEPAKYDPPVEKKVEVKNGTVPAGSEYTFVMTPEDKNAPMPENTEAVSDPATGSLTMKKQSPGSYEFGWIYFDEDDIGKTYVYTVKEQAGTDSNFTYDSEIYTLTVEVTVKDRKIVLNASYVDSKGEATEKAVFTNIYNKDTPTQKPPVKHTPTPSARPKTGDSENMMLYIILLAAALMGVGAAAVYRVRQKNE